jgi:hypothetical protein
MVIGRRPVPYAPPMTNTFETIALELGTVVGDYCLWVTPTAKHFILEQRSSWLDWSSFCRGADQTVLHVRPKVAAGCWRGVWPRIERKVSS